MMCPKCKVDHAVRSHRHGLIDRCVSLAGYYPYTCRDCHLRFLKSHGKAAEEPGRHSRVEREIKATRGALKSKRRKRELLLYGAAVVLFLTFLYYITRDRGSSMEGGCLVPASDAASIAS